MTSNMNISAKDTIYNVKVACNGELRRFALADFNFETLSAQVAQVFGVPRAEGLTFQYVDDEGDKITMSSDIELKAALELFQGVLRLELILKGEAQAKTAAHHWGHRKHLLRHGPHLKHRRHHMKRWRRIVKLQKRGMRHAGMRQHHCKGLWGKMAMRKFAKRHMERIAEQRGMIGFAKGWRQWPRVHHERHGHQLHQHFPKSEWEMPKMDKCLGRRHLWRMFAGSDEVGKRRRCASPTRGGACGFGRRFRHHSLCGEMEKVGSMHWKRRMLFGKREGAWKRPVA